MRPKQREKPPHESVVRLYEAARILRGISSPADVARLFGDSDQRIGNWRTRGISKEGALKAQELIGCSATWLLEGAGPMTVLGKHISALADTPVIGQNTNLSAGLSGITDTNIRRNDTTPGPEIRGKVPLLRWDQARTWDDLMDSFAEKDAQRWLDCPAPHSAGTFCLSNNTDTMDDGTAAGYREGEILFVDPAVDIAPERDVIVILPSGKMLFRRLKEDSEGRYLLALNGRRIERWESGSIVRGVVIFSGIFR